MDPSDARIRFHGSDSYIMRKRASFSKFTVDEQQQDLSIFINMQLFLRWHPLWFHTLKVRRGRDLSAFKTRHNNLASCSRTERKELRRTSTAHKSTRIMTENWSQIKINSRIDTLRKSFHLVTKTGQCLWMDASVDYLLLSLDHCFYQSRVRCFDMGVGDQFRSLIEIWRKGGSSPENYPIV